MKYEEATFRILIDGCVQVEVSVKGCDDNRSSVTPDHLTDAGKTLGRIARAVQKIQRQNDRERGKRAAQAAA